MDKGTITIPEHKGCVKCGWTVWDANLESKTLTCAKCKELIANIEVDYENI